MDMDRIMDKPNRSKNKYQAGLESLMERHAVMDDAYNLHPEKVLERIVKSITYKPGWAVSIRRRSPTENGMWVHWSWRAHDATAPRRSWTGEPHAVVSGTPRFIGFHWPEGMVVREIHQSLIECEMHELNEFFRYKERIVFDPHRDFFQLMTISPEKEK